VISLTQRPLPNNTRHSQQTDIYALSGIGTGNPSKRAAQTHVLDGAATGIGREDYAVSKLGIATHLIDMSFTDLYYYYYYYYYYNMVVAFIGHEGLI